MWWEMPNQWRLPQAENQATTAELVSSGNTGPPDTGESTSQQPSSYAFENIQPAAVTSNIANPPVTTSDASALLLRWILEYYQGFLILSLYNVWVPFPKCIIFLLLCLHNLSRLPSHSSEVITNLDVAN